MAGAEDKSEAGFLCQGCLAASASLPAGRGVPGPRNLELTAPPFGSPPTLGFPARRAPRPRGGPHLWAPRGVGSVRKGKRRGRGADSPTPLCSRGELSGARDSKLEPHVQVPVKKDLSKSRIGPVPFKGLLACITLKYMYYVGRGPLSVTLSQGPQLLRAIH